MSRSVEVGEHPLDLLQRIGTMGAIQATASLSALAGKPVVNSYAKIKILPLEEVPGLFGDPEEVIAGVIFEVSGHVRGQYIATFLIRDALALVAALNRLGSERWECFWIETQAHKKRFFFKRPAKSYLRTLPARELLKLVAPDAGQ